MSKQNRDILEEMFHAKLYDHEVDTMPDDWEKIVNRLPESEPVVVHTFRRRWLYWSAAAIALLVMTTGILFLTDENPTAPVTAEKARETIEKPPVIEESVPITEPAIETPMVAAATTTESGNSPSQIKQRTRTVVSHPIDPNNTEEILDHTKEIPVSVEKAEITTDVSQPVIPDTHISPEETKQPVSTTRIAENKPRRRWGFGMGGGSLTAGASNTFNTLVQPSASFQTDENMLLLNAPLKNVDYKTELKHKTPVSIGLSASYYLTDRWSILAGINYSLLVSESKQNAAYHKDEEQRLHFIGIPISVAYRIAEWNRLQVYASAGIMPEINVAGKYKITKFADNEVMETTTESVRMRDLYWSVNARGGVSYPVIRFVNAFAEVGAAYYFDNGSDIKTIHSEKPFNVSFNFGLRFGF